MHTMCESEHYVVLSEFESVFLYIKDKTKRILIGYFYSDPEIARISPDERFCIMGGEGIIVYYLDEPFAEYSGLPSEQWMEWGRDDPENIMWVESIRILDATHVEIVTEDRQKLILGV